ncbi:hypothetical protein [Paenibacillus wulumuqiensis]|uniref:hypothetical protein n=1 Tax=Paenibacillus wulumuqiensis TaxID=1567107 RepID=UPI000619F442|nr:hypothetical protein [Paenibacillus wulumuqiensis]
MNPINMEKNTHQKAAAIMPAAAFGNPYYSTNGLLLSDNMKSEYLSDGQQKSSFLMKKLAYVRYRCCIHIILYTLLSFASARRSV